MKEPVKMEVMSIVHGKSEFIFCNSIKSNLRLKHEVIARQRGSMNIQVTSIMDILNDSRFKTCKDFKRTFNDVAFKKDKLLNFKLFIIMDVDDCSAEQNSQFKSGRMFKGHWLYEHIVPIYNDPTLEATINELGIPVEHGDDHTGRYIKIFPTNHGDLNMDIAKDYLNRFKQCKHSNLYEYLQYCISIAEKRI